MLKEGRVVRPGAQSFELQARMLLCLFFRLGGAPHEPARALPFGDAGVRFGVDDVPRDLVHEPLERVRAGGTEESAAVAVGVDIRDRLLREILGVRLDPLCRADQARLLAVPSRVHDRAPRLPPGPRERAERFRLGQLGHEAADRVLRAVHPRVVVVSAQNPLVRKLRALQHREDVAHRLHPPVERELQVSLRGTGPEVIREGQRAAPRLGRDGARESLQERQRVGPRERQDGNLRERRRVLAVEALRVLRRADAGRERVAREDRHVRDRAALRPGLVSEAALRIRVALEIAVVPRIGVDEPTPGPVLEDHLRLYAAPRAPVAREDYLALHVPAASLELLVILRHAVVPVDDLGGHVPVDGVRVVDRKLFVLLPRRRIFGKRGLGERRRERRRRDHLQDAGFRDREQDRELLDPRLEAEGPEKGHEEPSVLLVVRRPHVVRARGEAFHPGALLRRVERRVERRLEGALGGGALRVEAEKRGRRRRLGGGARARRSEGDDKSEKRAETPPESAHESSPGAGGYRGGPAGSARPDDLSVLYFAASIFWTRAPYMANNLRPTSVFFATHSAFWNASGDTSRRSSSR